jgi:Putative zinc-finger
MTQSGRIPDTHAEAWALLPFLANGRIAPEDREWVELHVHSCDECRCELDDQRSLVNHMRASDVPFDTSEHRSFSKLWTRIEAAEAALPPEQDLAVRETPAAPRRNVRWLAAAVVVQAVGLALLGVTALNSSEDFRTVTSSEMRHAGPAVRLVFTADASIADVTEILGRHQLEMVAGPRGAGVFTAALPAQRDGAAAETIAAALRRNPHVQFAEPVTP